MSGAAKGSERLRWIDTLRGLAACVVVLHHLNDPVRSVIDKSLYVTFVSYGWLGVYVFFVISGFSIGSSLDRVTSLADYSKKRFFRIYPPYIASLVVCIICVSIYRLCTGNNDLATFPRNLPDALRVLTLATHPVSDLRVINWVYWTLSYEVAFYILLGLTVLLSRFRWPLLVSLTLVALAVGQSPPRALFFLNQWSFFALGVALAGARSRGGAFPCLLAAVCLLDFGLNQPLNTAITALVTVGLCAACLGRRGAWLNREKVMSQVGEWSYGLYLIHVPIGCWLIVRAAKPILSSGVLGRVVGDFIILLICIAFSSVFFRYVERPAMQLWRRRSTPMRPIPNC